MREDIKRILRERDLLESLLGELSKVYEERKEENDELVRT